MQKLVSILGLGRYDKEEKKYYYEKVRYFWDERPEVETALIQEVWNAWFPNAQMLILATEEARKERKGDLERHPHWIVEDIPDGKNEAEFWQIYQKVVAKLDQGDEVILDITHGFRSLPVLTLLAASFLRSAKGVTIKHVLYGANEAKIEDKTPVFDLSPFLTMLDWASATNRFLETGDARKLRPLVETKGSKPFNVHLNSAVKELDSLSQALATNRALRSGELAKSAQEKLLKAQQEDWEPRHEPLKLLLPRLADSLTLLSRDKEGSEEEQLKQSFGQVRWLLQNQQFEKALGLAREWMVSFAQLKRQESWHPIQNMKRKEEEDWLNACAKGGLTPDDWRAFIDVWKDLGNLRNDLMHFGFREAARSEESIPKEVGEKIDALRKAVSSLGLKLPEAS